MKRLIRLFVIGSIAASWLVASPPAALAETQPAESQTSCDLGNGVKHVITITFDNTHFKRDRPNVPSDLEQMPHLLNFLNSNGTVLTNHHTPLISHTPPAPPPSLAGVYAHLHGARVSNSFRYYMPNANPSLADTSLGL